MTQYEAAKKRYAERGVDTDAAINTLKSVPVSLHCWQGDDVRGFDGDPNAPLTGGIQTTGNYPGRARTPEELMADIDEVLRLCPGTKKLNLHASYGEFGGRRVDREAQRRRVEHLGLETALIGLAQDHEGRHDDQHALENGGKVFHLVVAVGMVGVRGRGAHANRHEGGQRRHHVDDALQRIRVQREAAGQPEGEELQPRDHQPDDGAGEGGFLGAAHDGSGETTRRL